MGQVAGDIDVDVFIEEKAMNGRKKDKRKYQAAESRNQREPVEVSTFVLQAVDEQGK